MVKPLLAKYWLDGTWNRLSLRTHFSILTHLLQLITPFLKAKCSLRPRSGTSSIVNKYLNIMLSRICPNAIIQTSICQNTRSSKSLWSLNRIKCLCFSPSIIWSRNISDKIRWSLELWIIEVQLYYSIGWDQNNKCIAYCSKFQAKSCAPQLLYQLIFEITITCILPYVKILICF